MADEWFKKIGEDERRKIVIDFINAHLGCTAQDIVDGLRERKNSIGRVKVFRILKELKKENVVLTKRLNPKSRNINLFVNNDNPLVSVPRELEIFEKNFKRSLEEARRITQENYAHAISRLAVGGKKQGDSPKKEETQIISDFAAINAQPFYILYALVEVYFLNSTALWPTVIKDKDALKDLYVFVFKKIIDIQNFLFKSLKSTQIGNHGNMADIIVPYISAKLYMTTRLRRCIEVYTKFNMQKEFEPLIDSLWKIQRGLLHHIYPEPQIYGWDFNYDLDDWRKLLQLQIQHPEQSYANYVFNEVKSSAYSELDWVKNSAYIKRQTKIRNKKK